MQPIEKRDPAPSSNGHAGTSGASKNGAEIVTPAELAEFGLSPRDVYRRCPWAIEYTGLYGGPCWLRGQLGGLLREPQGEDES
jgi:hypothetical protein